MNNYNSELDMNTIEHHHTEDDNAGIVASRNMIIGHRPSDTDEVLMADNNSSNINMFDNRSRGLK